MPSVPAGEPVARVPERQHVFIFGCSDMIYMFRMHPNYEVTGTPGSRGSDSGLQAFMSAEYTKEMTIWL